MKISSTAKIWISATVIWIALEVIGGVYVAHGLGISASVSDYLTLRMLLILFLPPIILTAVIRIVQQLLRKYK